MTIDQIKQGETARLEFKREVPKKDKRYQKTVSIRFPRTAETTLKTTLNPAETTLETTLATTLQEVGTTLQTGHWEFSESIEKSRMGNETT